MLYCKDTKLKKKQKKVIKTNINKYVKLSARALAVNRPIVGCGKIR